MKFDETKHIERYHYDQQEIELNQLKLKLAHRMVDAERDNYRLLKEREKLKARIKQLQK